MATRVNQEVTKALHIITVIELGFSKPKVLDYDTQGTSKINSHCTASVVEKRCTVTGKVTVEICQTHYGHKPTLGHLRLSKSDRMEIASRLSQGVKFDYILDNIRDKVEQNTSIDEKRSHQHRESVSLAWNSKTQ